jgi:16S rRNA (cytosine967-C5)-methyltransferase
VGAYQLTYHQTPSYAVINECVNATNGLRKPWARGLINQVLRNLEEVTPETPEQSFDHSSWLIEKICAQYPESWENILNENNQRAPMTLRINLKRPHVALSSTTFKKRTSSVKKAFTLRHCI